MAMKWLCTTAILLTVGGGVAIAQSPADTQKKREQHQSLSPKEPGRSAAGEEHLGGASRGSRGDRTGSLQREGAKEPRGAGETRAKEREQAQGRQAPERQPNRQAEKLGRGEHQPALAGQNEERGRTARGAEQNAQERQATSGRDREGMKQSEQKQKEQNPRAAQSRQTPATERNGPAAQHNEAAQQDQNAQHDRKQAGQQPQRNGNSQANETARPGENERQRQTVGQTPDRSRNGEQRSAVSVNQDQRRQVVDRLHRDHDFTRENQNINMRVSVGERLPDHVRARPLPPDIVDIVPQYRDYDYTVIDNRVEVINPRTREIVDVLDEGGGGYAERGYSQGYSESRSRISLSSDDRELLLKQGASTTVGSTGGGNSACVTLQRIPEELAQRHPELASDRYIAIGNQIVLVDPRERKIVQVID